MNKLKVCLGFVLLLIGACALGVCLRQPAPSTQTSALDGSGSASPGIMLASAVVAPQAGLFATASPERLHNLPPLGPLPLNRKPPYRRIVRFCSRSPLMTAPAIRPKRRT